MFITPALLQRLPEVCWGCGFRLSCRPVFADRTFVHCTMTTWNPPPSHHSAECWPLIYGSVAVRVRWCKNRRCRVAAQYHDQTEDSGLFRIHLTPRAPPGSMIPWRRSPSVPGWWMPGCPILFIRCDNSSSIVDLPC